MYLQNHNNTIFLEKKNSSLLNIIDYFSAPNILDLFNLGGDFNYNDQYFELLLNNSILLNDSSILNTQLFDTTYNLSTLNYKSLLDIYPIESLELIINDIKLITPANNNLDELINFFPERMLHFENFELSSLELDDSVFETLSTPDLKIFYPEPFIASPSFVHEDLWFLHILHFQHWLWFFFISLIMFFFITFVNVVRWCNIRTKPKRETRGVSRSKCADLITACVPVSWATAIIVTETVDAADYYDGFGTGEIVVGIRAYQWGWEYFYPKNIDLNYNVNSSYSALLGKSIKYFNTSTNTLKSNTLWKFYQKNNVNLSSVPAHLILSPTDNSNLLNFMDLDSIGISTIKDSTAFKKIQFFSKTNPSSLFNVKSDFENSLHKLGNLYNTDLGLTTSYSYGIDRQHNFSSQSALLPSYPTFLDERGIDKFFSYNFNLQGSISSGNNHSTNNLSVNRLSYNSLNTNKVPANNAYMYYNLISNSLKNTTNLSLSLLLKTPTLLSVYGAESDSKQYQNLFKYSLNYNFKKKLLWNMQFLNNENSLNNLNNLNPVHMFSNSIYNTENLLKFRDFKSSNSQFLGSERTVRLLKNLNSNSYKWNISASPNSTDTVLSDILPYGTAQDYIYKSSLLNWDDKNKYSRFSNNIVYMPNSHIPIKSNNPYFTDTSYDFFPKGQDDVTPMVLRGKEESTPIHVFNTYWSSYWSLSNFKNRLYSIDNSIKLYSTFYFPFFSEYAEYDFKNWSSIESMEDSFWESPYNSSYQDEYYSINNNLTSLDFSNKQETLFNTGMRYVKDSKLKSGVLLKPFLLDSNVNYSNINSLPIFSEEPLSNTKSIVLKDLNLFSNELTSESMEEGYESVKYVNYLYYLNYKNILNGLSNNIQPVSYTTVFDSFRSDYEDPYIYTDDQDLATLDSYSDNMLYGTNNNIRISNPFKLRSTVKNAMVTYSAMQKVFRSRFDEGRSNTRLEDFSNSYVKHPYLTDSRVPYESTLGKNKESFFKVNLYNHDYKTNYSEISPLFFSNNIYLMDLPFLVSMKSDPSRYLWFDWQSKWSSIEIAASSVSRYSLLGVPYSNKSFEYFTGLGDDLNDSQTYLIKLAKARKNYNSNWAFTPYFFSRVSNWYGLNLSTDQVSNSTNNLSVRVFLRNSQDYWTKNYFGYKTYNTSTPSFSSVNTPARSSWRPLSGVEFYSYSQNILVDILSKREYLYKQLYINSGFKPTLPISFLSSPENPLLLELKNLPTNIDPIDMSLESSRGLLYSNSTNLNLSLIKDLFLYTSPIHSILNTSLINNHVLVKLFGIYSPDNSINTDFYKNQYVPMKKGVSNMIKLHATGAIAMPIETRLHLLASSKDVIHSWAIPSAGVKIDCVPGYSSHRVVIFLVSGIFWGQCMEICGRFHHWMPIIVFFIKRDLFFLWCTHFMHFSVSDNTFNMSDRQLCDYTKPVSFSQSSWVTDINKLV